MYLHSYLKWWDLPQRICENILAAKAIDSWCLGEEAALAVKDAFPGIKKHIAAGIYNWQLPVSRTHYRVQILYSVSDKKKQENKFGTRIMNTSCGPLSQGSAAENLKQVNNYLRSVQEAAACRSSAISQLLSMATQANAYTKHGISIYFFIYLCFTLAALPFILASIQRFVCSPLCK